MLFGFTPILWLVCFLICMQNEVYCYGACLALLVEVTSEIVLRPLFSDPRPARTANRTSTGELKRGMPSGHCLLFYSMMVWCALNSGNAAMRRKSGASITGETKSSESHRPNEFDRRWFWSALVCIAPTPWARLHNGDHSLRQVVTSSLAGVVVGALAFWAQTGILGWFLQNW